MDEAGFAAKLRALVRSYEDDTISFDDYRRARTELLDEFEDEINVSTVRRHQPRVVASPQADGGGLRRWAVISALFILAAGVLGWFLLTRPM